MNIIIVSFAVFGCLCGGFVGWALNEAYRWRVVAARFEKVAEEFKANADLIERQRDMAIRMLQWQTGATATVFDGDGVAHGTLPTIQGDTDDHKR